MNNKNPSTSRYLLTVKKVAFIVTVTAAVVIVIGSYYLDFRERSWKGQWMKLGREIDLTHQELARYEMACLYAGTDYKVVDFDELIMRVKSSAREKVSNLVYEGSEGGFDFITHYTSTSTHRMKISENPAIKVSRFPRRQTAASLILIRLNRLTNTLSPIEDENNGI